MQGLQDTAKEFVLDPQGDVEKEMATHSVFLPGKSHGQRSLVGYSPWGRKESDTTERLHLHLRVVGSQPRVLSKCGTPMFKAALFTVAKT